MNRELRPRREAQKGQSPQTSGEEKQTRDQILALLFVLRILLEGFRRPLSVTHFPGSRCHQPVTCFEVCSGEDAMERG